MSKRLPRFTVRLFYSYSHKDSRHRKDMDDTLSLLKRQGLLTSWSDLDIVPGQSISNSIREQMDNVDIMAFLFSRHFIASDACMKEWYDAQRSSRPLVRIPIVISDCQWKTVLDDDDIKALPKDGNPVVSFSNQDTAWQEIFDGIKAVIEKLRTTYTPKNEYRQTIESLEFPSNRRILIQDIFVFPSLLSYVRTKGGQVRESIIDNLDDLLRKRHLIIHGAELSGKTTLLRHMYLSLVGASAPALLLDLQKLSDGDFDQFIVDNYQQQFSGDYSTWRQQTDKTLVIDNLSSYARETDFILHCKERFEIVIISCQTDLFNAFFSDDERFKGFLTAGIQPLSHSQQESLIRQRLAIAKAGTPVTDGHVDQVERQVNSVIVSKKILPRYPFFVLSIVQTHEAFMPEVSITSYGHCYYVLIISNLIKSGIPRTDDGINISFRFAEHLAFLIFQNTRAATTLDFGAVVSEYEDTYILPRAILSRLQSAEYGIITSEGGFKTQYMYFYFLARFLSRYSSRHKDIIQEMCDRPHLRLNYLTLLFFIHHTDDDWVIEDIVLRVMCAFDSVLPATLDRKETARFDDLVDELTDNILSDDNVETGRRKERELRDLHDDDVADGDQLGESIGGFGGNCYRLSRGNAILGQVLRNKYGTLERAFVEQIVETITDGGLRVVNAFLKDEKEIASRARSIHKEYPKHDLRELKNVLRVMSFLWTMNNIELVVNEINHREIREVVAQIVERKDTPAYDLIQYFSRLDASRELTPGTRDLLKTLLMRHRDSFLRRVLSIRTQHYLNTHRSNARVEQSVCSLLDLRYRSR